jgi:hypothetical protein
MCRDTMVLTAASGLLSICVLMRSKERASSFVLAYGSVIMTLAKKKERRQLLLWFWTVCTQIVLLLWLP